MTPAGRPVQNLPPEERLRRLHMLFLRRDLRLEPLEVRDGGLGNGQIRRHFTRSIGKSANTPVGASRRFLAAPCQLRARSLAHEAELDFERAAQHLPKRDVHFLDAGRHVGRDEQDVVRVRQDVAACPASFANFARSLDWTASRTASR